MSQETDDRRTILNAIITNTAIKIVFGGLDPDDAEYMMRVLFTGFLNLEEWKSETRPTAVGNLKEIVRSHSVAEHAAMHEMRSRTTAHSYGEARGSITSSGSANGSFSADGSNAGLVMQSPAQLLGPSAPGAQALPVPLTQSEGTSSSDGSSEMTSESHAESLSTIDMYSEAESEAYGRSRGTSVSHSETEQFVTQWADLSVGMFSLQEQQWKAIGDLINLPKRSCLLKVRNAPPVRTRTLDVEPAFRTSFARQIFLPMFEKRMRANSPYLHDARDVDRQIAARLDQASKPQPTKPQEQPVFEPAPMPHIKDADDFAGAFWAKRKPSEIAPQKPRKKPVHPKAGADPAKRRAKFKLIPGGKDTDGDKKA